MFHDSRKGDCGGDFAKSTVELSCMRLWLPLHTKIRKGCTSVQCTSLTKSRKIRNAFLANSASVIGGAIVSVVCIVLGLTLIIASGWRRG
jgi:hypothetical protein